MRRIRVLLVGAGRWGRVHARTVREAGGVLAGVVDIDRAAAERVAREHGARVYGGLGEALRRRDFDAAIVAVPPHALAGVAERLIEEGVHVLVEKPVATSSREAWRLAMLAERRGVVALAGYLLRFHPATRLAARLAPLVRLRGFRAERILPRPPNAQRWPLALDLTVHDADLLLYLTGGGWEPAAAVDERDTLILVYRRGGQLAELYTSQATTAKRRTLTLHGENGLIHLDYDANTAAVCIEEDCSTVVLASEKPLTLEHRAFYSLVARAEHGEEPHPLAAAAATLRDAARTLELIEAALSNRH